MIVDVTNFTSWQCHFTIFVYFTAIFPLIGNSQRDHDHVAMENLKSDVRIQSWRRLNTIPLQFPFSHKQLHTQ